MISKNRRMLSFSELKTSKGIRWTRQHVNRQVRDQKFPKPIHLGDQTVAWVESEIDAWLDERIAERGAA